MKTAVYENYKPTRYEGKGFLLDLLPDYGLVCEWCLRGMIAG